jgi:hypothetical protein
VIGRINDVSTWKVTLPTDTDAGRRFITDTFSRLEVVLDAEVWRSGPVVHLERDVSLDGDVLTVTGVDDEVWLAGRLAHPQPASSSPPYSTEAYDVHTGALSTYSGFEALTLYGGWTAGWDTGFTNLDGDSNFLGGFGYEINENVTFTYLNTWGNFGWRGGKDSYSHSMVLVADLTDNLQYVGQSDVLDATANPNAGEIDTEQIDAERYARYRRLSQ